MTATADPPVQPIDLTPQAVQAWLAEAGSVLIDVREPSEHRAERIDGAVLMPLSRFDPGAIQERYLGKQVILHCAGGKRSAKACRQLDPQGPTYHLAGGIEAWKQAGLPTLKPAQGGAIPIMRQVHIAAGSLVVLGLLLGYTVHQAFVLLSAFVGCGLLFAGLSGWCGMAKLLGTMPWNRSV